MKPINGTMSNVKLKSGRFTATFSYSYHGKVYGTSPVGLWKAYVYECAHIRFPCDIIVQNGRGKPQWQMRWPAGIYVGSLWLKRNLNDEELASYIAERMRA